MTQKMVVVEIKDGIADVVWSDFDSKDLCGAELPTITLVHVS